VAVDRTGRPGQPDRPELLYVSWGGTGRAATVREAIGRAGATGRGLVYLAILDDAAFGDIDDAMLDLAGQELAWLLEAQLDLTRSQTNLEDVPVRVLVRTGDVAERVGEAAQAVGATEVLIGAPVTVAGSEVVADLVAVVRDRVPVPVEVIEP
jgi:hypothetical protein